MAGRAHSTSETPRPAAVAGARVLVIEAPYYNHIAEALAAGAIAELEAAGAAYERIQVPGALEIPLALGQAVSAGLIGASTGAAADPDAAVGARFDGCVALGCVIRGETTHYETVCANANHWLMDIAVRHAVPLGNAILTVETEEQALTRAEGGRLGKGADAVRACLALIGHARAFAARRHKAD
jgi:6,7-dimethyl-8-ribityllumazine synthase